jgi:rhodanese-related sulfurtransferase
MLSQSKRLSLVCSGGKQTATTKQLFAKLGFRAVVHGIKTVS